MFRFRFPDGMFPQYEHPPTAPPPFPTPSVNLGRRETVLIFYENGKPLDVAENVLFRDPESPQAYWPIHDIIQLTIMGRIEVCYVLVPAGRNNEINIEGRIYKIYKLTSQRVAVKVNYGFRMERYQGRHAENPRNELSAMQLLRGGHPNVIKALEALQVGSDLNIVMPYASSGDLLTLIVNGRIPEGEAKKIFRQLMDGVQFFHKNGICHRDLSPENIMRNEDGSIVIIDMGMAIRIPYTDRNDPSLVTDIEHGTHKRLILPQGTAGKAPYMSPEVYRNQEAFDGEAVDVWSAGTILLRMVTGKSSYSIPDDADGVFWCLTNALPEFLRHADIHLSSECVDLLQGMLKVDPLLRYSVQEVLHHPWVTNA